MTMPTPPRRSWYQFTLRELFWLALVVALASVAIRERQQRLAADERANNIDHMIYDLARANEDLRVNLEKSLREAEILRLPGFRSP
jgi:hypothetical protein